MKLSRIFVGFDPREQEAFEVACKSTIRHLSLDIPVVSLRLKLLQDRGLYRRGVRREGNVMIDVPSKFPMATEFAVTRFFVPQLMRRLDLGNHCGWALFMDCDMLVRDDLAKLSQYLDPSKAVVVVKHDHKPAESEKMDGQVQSAYARKNWSSVILWNCDHPANEFGLTLEVLNSRRGLDLHQFFWLRDDEIGELPQRFNYLVGTTSSKECPDPAIVHFTEGGPWFPKYETVEFADEWRAELAR